jgi:uncharacterized protein involved in exopolysaccharide biosynthesis
MTYAEDVTESHNVVPHATPTLPSAWEDRISPLAALATLIRYRYVIIFLAGMISGMSALGTWMFRQYTAESRFVPEVSEANASQVAGLAAQFGINIGSMGNGGESIDFYVQLLHSRELLDDVITTVYRIPTDRAGRDTVQGTYLDLLRIAASTPQRRLLIGVQKLEGHMEVSRDAKAGVVTLRTTAPWPALAEELNRQLLERVAAFNQQKRRSKAAAERAFVAGRLTEAQRQLDSAEEDLARFLDQNRSYTSSPQLTFEKERKERHISVYQRVFSTLAESYERARVEEVRNTPLVTVIDRPEGSARPSKRILRSILVGGFAGIAIGVAFAFLCEYRDRQRQDFPEAYQELRTALRRATTEAFPGRIVRRLVEREK